MNGRRIIRVFPRRTRATPTDDLVRTSPPFLWDEADEVHISVAFSWDLPAAERLEMEWKHVAPTYMGGPACGSQGDEFTPGMYLRDGYTITTRGCPNRCWFCDVWRREGDVRELPIRDGWNVLDSNLLAASDNHFRAVCEMLARQKHRAEFTGGLEAARMKSHHIDALRALRPRPVIWLAYDEPRDLGPMLDATGALRAAGWGRSHDLMCYVLCGYRADTLDAAEARMNQVVMAGATPMAMVYRDKRGLKPDGWGPWQRRWARPALIHAATRQDRSAPDLEGDPAAVVVREEEG